MSNRELWSAVAVTGIAVCVWVALRHLDWAGRMEDMQDQINDLRMDMLHRKPPTTTEGRVDQGAMRRVK